MSEAFEAFEALEAFEAFEALEARAHDGTISRTIRLGKGSSWR
jgi:hypothetical protein